jgi:hypothetical protein
MNAHRTTTVRNASTSTAVSTHSPAARPKVDMASLLSTLNQAQLRGIQIITTHKVDNDLYNE